MVSMATTKITAFDEVTLLARDLGYNVEVGRVEHYRTHRKGYDSTIHRLFPVFITLSDTQREINRTVKNYSFTWKPFVVLFNENKSYYRAFRGTLSSRAELDAVVEKVQADRVARGWADDDNVVADIRYRRITNTRQAISKKDVLEALELEEPSVKKAVQDRREAEQQVKEIARLTEVRDNNRRTVEEKSDAAAQHLEALRQKLVAVHPVFENAPGLVDTVLLEILGEDNTDDNPVVQFIAARAGITQAIAEATKAEALLGTYEAEEVSA